MKKAVILISLCCLLATLLCCGGSNTTLVYISATTTTVTVGGYLQLTANVPVTWSVSGKGTIDSTGLFKAGTTTGTVTVKAVASDGSGSSGTLTLTIVAAGTSTSTTSSSASGISHRVFVSNSYAGGSTPGVLNIVDADADLLSTHTITMGGSPTFMLQSTDQTVEVVYDSTNNILGLVTNSTETVSDKISLANTAKSAAIIPGDSAAFAAVPAAATGGVSGTVYRVNFTTGGTLSVGIQGARYLSMDHSGVNMLVFSQNSDTVSLVTSAAGTLTSNSGALTSQTLPSTATNCLTSCFSRPVAAVFSSDDTTAYVLSSGPVNGGTQAMVTVLDMTKTLQTASQATPTLPIVVQTLSVSGANVGLLQGTQLYVAGAQTTTCSTGTCQQAVLSVIDTSTNTLTTSVPFGQVAPNIVPGVLTFDGTNLWIGSTGCQVTAGALSCLSQYLPGNPAGSQINTNSVPCVAGSGSSCTVLNDQTDDVTSMVWLQPFNGRKVMYVIEGGELLLYDNTFAQLVLQGGSNAVIDIVGQAVDAKAAK